MPFDAPLTPEPHDNPPALELGTVLQRALELAQQRDTAERGHDHTNDLLGLLIHWTGVTARAAVKPGRPALQLIRDVPIIPAPDLEHVSTTLPVQPAPALRSICAHTRTLSMGRAGYGTPCRLPIVQHAPDLPWVHAGNAIDAAEAGRDHAAIYWNDCKGCSPDTPFWSDSVHHLNEHLRDVHDIDVTGVDGWWNDVPGRYDGMGDGGYEPRDPRDHTHGAEFEAYDQGDGPAE